MSSLTHILLILAVSISTFAETKLSLVRQIDESTKLLQSYESQPQVLESEFRKVYEFLRAVDPKAYDIQEIKKEAFSINKNLAQLRNQLRDQVALWKAKGPLTPEFEKELRGVMRASHYLTDYVSEISGLESLPMRYEDFKSGDVILMRGGSSISAAIARIADFKSLFSHVAIVYVHPTTKEKFLIEALIESGVIISSLKKNLEKMPARMTVLRSLDQKLAENAAQIGYDLVTETLKNKKPLLYDFTMSLHRPDFNNLSEEKFFCSKVISWLFDLASNGHFQLPFLPSRMTQENRNFLQRLNISDNTQEMFAPGDMEFEPTVRFKVISEYRDIKRTAASRLDDLIFDKVFEWMERDGLTFDEPKLLKTLGAVAYQASHVSLISKAAVANGVALAPHIPAQVITTVLMLVMTRNKIIKAITPGMEEYLKTTGMAAPPKVVYNLLEKFYSSQTQALKFLAKPSAVDCKKAVVQN